MGLHLVGAMQAEEMSSDNYWSEGRVDVIVPMCGFVYEKDAFNVKMTLRNSIYLTKLCHLVFSIIFKHTVSFQKKAIKENCLAT